MGRWTNKKIKDFAFTASGGTPSTAIKEFWENGTIPWINSGELSQNDFIKSATTFITELALQKSSAKLMPVDTVVIALTGATTGMSALLEIETSGNQSITGIYPSQEHDSLFLLYWLQQNIDTIIGFNIGSAQPHINKGIVDNLNVYMPDDVTEQETIAKIIRKVHSAIEQTEALIAKYQRIKTGLMQDLLTCGIDEQGNIRSKATHCFVVKNGIEVPEVWEVDCLEKFCFIHNNLRKPISSLERFEKKGVYPYYGATGIIDYIDEYRVDGKYVLIGEDGDHFLKFEKQNMTHLVEGKFNVSNHAHILSGKENCLTEWIHYFFCNRDITYFLTRQGAGRFKLNKATLMNLPMYIPKDKEEQKRIIEKIVAFEKQFQNIQNHLEKLQSLKTGLMQDLLSGKVRVKVELEIENS